MRHSLNPLRSASFFFVVSALVLTFNKATIAAPEDSSASATPNPSVNGGDAQPAQASALAVQKAADALRKEFQAHEAKPSAAIRSECNFFTENPDPAANPKAIVDALGREYGDTATGVYVRWQLLSGISGTVDPSLASALAGFYSNAPIGPMRPGLDPEQKVEFTRAISGLKERDVSRVNEALVKKVKDWETTNRPFIAYRDEIAKKLPVSFGLVTAEFHDAVQRVTYGIDGAEVIHSAIKSGRDWALGQDAQPDQVRQLSANVASLLREMGDEAVSLDSNEPLNAALAGADSNMIWTVAYAKASSAKRSSNAAKAPAVFPPKFFTAVTWNAKSRALEWKTGTAKFATTAELAAFRKDLAQANQTDSIKAKSKANGS